MNRVLAFLFWNGADRSQSCNNSIFYIQISSDIFEIPTTKFIKLSTFSAFCPALNKLMNTSNANVGEEISFSESWNQP